MGKIRVKTLGDETQEKEQAEKAKARREGKQALKTHVKGVGLKGGQQLKVMEGTELKPEVEKLLHETPLTEPAKKTKKKAKVRVRSKKYLEAKTMVDKTKTYPLAEAVALLKKTSYVKFDATIEAHMNINSVILDKEKTSLSGSVRLPHTTGKKRVVKIADEALLTQIGKGKIDFDVLVAHPQLMPKLSRYAKILGPKGLLPNPKNQTVTTDPEKRAQELEAGETNWKTEPNNPIIHLSIAKVSHPEKDIAENIEALVNSIDKTKIAKLTLSSTMGPGIKVDISSF